MFESKRKRCKLCGEEMDVTEELKIMGNSSGSYTRV